MKVVGKVMWSSMLLVVESDPILVPISMHLHSCGCSEPAIISKVTMVSVLFLFVAMVFVLFLWYLF